MKSDQSWHNAIPDALWTLPRITRVERMYLGSQSVDANLLSSCANEGLAILIDRCSPENAALLLCEGVTRLNGAFMWVIAADDVEYRILREVAEDFVVTKRWRKGHQVYDLHPKYMRACEWAPNGLRMLLNDVSTLQADSSKNPLKRDDILALSFPVVAIVDSELSLCKVHHGFDPAWAIRDLLGRLQVRQGPTPVLIFTSLDSVAVFPARLKAAFGVEAFLYLDGSSTASRAWRVRSSEV